MQKVARPKIEKSESQPEKVAEILVKTFRTVEALGETQIAKVK